MKHKPLQSNPEQRSNLMHLAEYLDTGITECEFNMATWGDGCGSAACAVGHGPFIGIKMTEREGLFEEWTSYALRVFGVAPEADLDGTAFEFLFGVEWSGYRDCGPAHVHSTARAAAARIYYALEHGIPPRSEWLKYPIAPAPRVSLDEITERVKARLAAQKEGYVGAGA